MNELRPHSRQLLEAARRQWTPTSSERERLIGELLASVDPEPGSGAAARSRRPGKAAQLLLLAALFAAIGAALYAVSHLPG